MLMSKRAGVNSTAFLGGWIVGIFAVITIVIVVSESLGTTTDGQPSPGVATTELVLGVLLLGFAIRRWRNRPGPGEEPHFPKWLQTIDTITPVKSLGLGVLLSAVNPKNPILMIGGGLAIAGATASTGDRIGASVIFALLAASTVVLPVVIYQVMGMRAQATLNQMRTWLGQNNTAVMSVLLLVIGVVLIGKGIAAR